MREIRPARNKRALCKTKSKSKAPLVPELTAEDLEDFEAFRAFRDAAGSRVHETLGTRRGRRPPA